MVRRASFLENDVVNQRLKHLSFKKSVCHLEKKIFFFIIWTTNSPLSAAWEYFYHIAQGRASPPASISFAWRVDLMWKKSALQYIGHFYEVFGGKSIYSELISYIYIIVSGISSIITVTTFVRISYKPDAWVVFLFLHRSLMSNFQ